ncbi:MAG: phosphopantetheine-binding protein [Acidobacteriota bacterium]
MTTTDSAAHAGSDAQRSVIRSQIKTLLIERLHLDDVTPADINDDQPLFGDDGLGLDSVDALELVLAIEQGFDIKVEDEEVDAEVLGSVDAIASFVLARQAAA